MGDFPCKLCGTPGTKIVLGKFLSCAGCGLTRLELVVQYLRKKRKPITFDKACARYEKFIKNPKAVGSLGKWLIDNNLEVIAKP